jgi:hypothetical protein
VTFKLSQPLDLGGDPKLPFQLYDSYIKENRSRFPESCLQIIEHPDWTGGSASRAPYYSDVVSLVVSAMGSPTAQLKLSLYKHEYLENPLSIEIIYDGLFDLEIPSASGYKSPLTWRYEQFLWFDAYRSHKIKDKMFTHQIEWTQGSIWSITAKEITVRWITLTPKSGQDRTNFGL